MYYNGCKFARSNQPNKYKLAATKNAQAEKFVGKLCERLATVMSPIYKMAAPDAFHNQVKLEKEGDECRLGENTEEYSKPFSGVTACMDFCAHAHKDQHNMDSGSTLVILHYSNCICSTGLIIFTLPVFYYTGCDPD